ncbi:SseB family protein [Streptomyces sp. NBC_01537]|uniref:SseB family protein n=1 Tax=Streptomyces sp. NBC_01537 TaxID=2903896 RepID=UPI00386D45A4
MPTTGTTEFRRWFGVLLGEFRRTAVLVPLDAGGGMWSAELGGIRWIYAFSDEAELARFAAARGARSESADPGWEFISVLGARLLDVVIPQVGVPTGVALDVAGERPVMLPPVAGIVPDAVAVDA